MKKRTRIKWKNVIKATALVVTVGVGVSCVWANKDTPEPTNLNPKMIAEAHIQEEGFKEYKIPVEFAAEGGRWMLGYRNEHGMLATVIMSRIH